MSIPAFAWVYGQYRQVMTRLEATAVWQAVRRWSRIAQYSIRTFVIQLKTSQKPARISFQR
jgi:hypothetical protein